MTTLTRQPGSKAITHRSAPGLRSSATSAAALLILLPVLACGSPHFSCDDLPGSPRGDIGKGAPTVVVLALDGFRHDLRDSFSTPGLDHLDRLGAKAGRLLPVFPSETAPTFTSLVTGVYPESHGVLGNTFLDRERDIVFRDGMHSPQPQGARWNLSEPLWATLRDRGLRTASLDWPRADWNRDERGPEIDCESRPWAGDRWKVEEVGRLLGEPPELRPHLILVYSPVVDATVHRHGTAGPELRRAVQEADELVGDLLDGILSSHVGGRVHMLVVSDHGFTDRDDRPPVVLDDFLDLPSWRLVTSGAYSALWARKDAPTDTGADVRALEAADLPVRVYAREDIPAELRYRSSGRAPDYLLLADEGAVVGTRADLADVHGGLHGYEPSLPSMGGIVLLTGPRVRKGVRTPAVSAVDIHSVVLELLDVTPYHPVDGTLEPFAAALCDSVCAGEGSAAEGGG